MEDEAASVRESGNEDSSSDSGSDFSDPPGSRELAVEAAFPWVISPPPVRAECQSLL